MVYAACAGDGEDFVSAAADYSGVVLAVGRQWWGRCCGVRAGKGALEVDCFEG